MPLRLAKLEGHAKWVWSPRENLLSMVDIEKDPSELTPRVLHDSNGQYEELTSELKHWFLATDLTEAEPVKSQSDEEILRSLGYAQ